MLTSFYVRELDSYQLLYLVLHTCLFYGHEGVHSATYVTIDESLSKSICHYTGSFSNTKEIQPALNDQKQFPQFADCKLLRWSKCTSDCTKFERSKKQPHCSSKNKNDTTDSHERQAKIVGGEDVFLNEFPFQARVTFQGVSFCGGSIYNREYIISAAHCFHDTKTYEEYGIILGDHSIKMRDSTEQSFAIKTVTIHERFRKNTKENDIAVVKLSSPMTFTNGVQPILLPRPNYKPCGSVIATGWGRTIPSNSNSGSDILQKVNILISPFDKCKRAYGFIKWTVFDTNVCAGLIGFGEKDVCRGDSGGPLAKKLRNGSYVLVGITSFGEQCGDPVRPGVYTSVVKYLNWIRSKAI